MEVRTRIAPSPTGYPHIGTIYQAMFDFVFAKKTKGKFIVRIEDTDRNRFVEDAEKVIFESLSWFGLTSDEDPIKGGEYGPYRQSERLAIYQKYAKELIDKKMAYYCFCTKERLDQMRQEQEAQKLPPMYDKHCLLLSKEELEKNLQEKKPYVIRMKIPENRKIKVNDLVLGQVEFDSNLIDHQIIVKADGFPTYHLAVVVDDYLMKISQVFRGQEWLPSTPKHILLYEYFGWQNNMPQFIHLPVILNSEGGGKLSKRHGHASVDFYKKEGYLPEAILNYLANIVWNHSGGKEIFPIEELGDAIRADSENRIEKVEIYSQGPRFDLQKLTWMNGEYIRAMSDQELTKRLQEFLVDLSDGALAKSDHPSKGKIEHIVPLIKERIKKLSDFVPLTDFLWEAPEYDMVIFQKLNIKDQNQVLKKILEALEKMPEPWGKEDFEVSFQSLAKELGLNNTQMFQLIRVAISGQTVTPPLFESIQILGEEETISRLKMAAEFLKS